MAGQLRMHDDEIDIPIELVERLVAAQFPEWAGLELELLLPWGTDNALFRLGDDKLVRLPRRESVVGQVERDVRILPLLAPRLPVAIPEVLATGAPSGEYPWAWGVYRWL
ncbi:MAG TPA: phosphotransferase, partial [Gaiellaceae bacterium]|nr:phosphotransferase [Gaiellaceae bacterium]